MAKMLPPLIDQGIESAAERKLFDKMAVELPDDWYVLHSVGMPNHPRKLWAEIDFVLVGPSGAYCLEVKGGGVSRRDNVWYSVDRHGIEHRLKDPVDQVASASSALYAFLRDGLPRLSAFFVGYAVVFPDVDWPQEDAAPDLEALIYTAEDYRRSFDQFVRGLSVHWNKKVESMRRQKIAPLAPKSVRAIVEHLRHDFDLRPAMSTQVGQIREQLARYTSEQYQVLDGFADTPRVMIRGGAGTGKTWMALEEAIRRADAGQRVLLTCFNKRLGEMLARETAAFESITATHMHGWMGDLLRQAEMTIEGDASDSRFWLDQYPQAAIDALSSLGMNGYFDALVVDEAQDLFQPGFAILWENALSGGLSGGEWRLFYDEHQNLFGEIDEALVAELTATSSQFRLTINCRNTQSISAAVAKLSGVAMPRVLKAEGPSVAELWFRSDDDLHQKVSETVERCVKGGIEPNEIVVLARRKLENTALVDGIRGSDYGIQGLDDVAPLDPRSVRFSTIAGFKGLEAPALIVIGVDQPDGGEINKGMYVGLSRASAFLTPILDVKLKPAYAELASKSQPA